MKLYCFLECNIWLYFYYNLCCIDVNYLDYFVIDKLDIIFENGF